MCKVGALQRQVDLQGVFVKIGASIKLKGFLVEFLENRSSSENQNPSENRQNTRLFWASPFTMRLVCTLLIQVSRVRKGARRGKFSPQPRTFFGKTRSQPVESSMQAKAASSTVFAAKSMCSLPVTAGNFVTAFHGGALRKVGAVIFRLLYWNS